MNCNIIDYLNLDENDERLHHKIILKDKNHTLTYKDLIDKALTFGKHISDIGYFNQPIGVLAGHGIETIVMFLGLIYSGNHYIPLAEDIGAERLEKIVKLSHLELICSNCDVSALKGLASSKVNYLNYLDVQTILSKQKKSFVTQDKTLLKEKRSKLPKDAPLYVIFTSGSTGEPKGIMKTHQGMMSFIDTYIESFGFEKEDVLANQTPFYFDASAKDIYLMLKKKCRMDILDAKLFVMPIKLVEYLNEHKVTIIQWVPSALSILSRLNVFKKIVPEYLKKVLFVGEVFQIDQLKIWMAYLPDTAFINLYGASEICGICTYYKIQSIDELDTHIPIGYPASNCEVYLINENGIVENPHEVGEIYIRSESLATGYLNNEQKSREVFVQKMLHDMPEGTYYKSGDMAKYGENKALIFVSRKDFQIKHMGYRIELGEIEMIVCLAEEIRNAGCVYHKDRIVLFYEGDLEKGELTTYLKQKLPLYMIPNRMIKLEALPLNANGKIDRMALMTTL